MTVSVQQTKVLYTGNSNTTQWDIPFPFLSKEDLKIYVLDAYGIKTQVTEDFAIDTALHVLTYPLQSNGAAPLTSQQRLLIVRNTPLVQETAFAVQDTLDPVVLEKGYDKAMLIAQELTAQLDRCVKMPEEDSSAQANMSTYLEQLSQDIAQASAAAASAQSSATSAQTVANNMADISSAQTQIQQDISTLQTTASSLSSAKAETDLSNLTSTGEAHFAAPNLSNLDSTGEAHFANPSLSNLTETGKICGAKLAMPSDTKVDLTLGASGSTYTAPANGWVAFVKQATGDQYFQARNTTTGWFNNVYGTNGKYASIIFPIKKSHVFRFDYDLGGSTALFCFIYAEGSKSEAN